MKVKLFCSAKDQEIGGDQKKVGFENIFSFRERTNILNSSSYYLVLIMIMNHKKMTRGQIDSKVREFVERCRQSGRKVTVQRITVYKELVRSEDHPSAEILYRRIKKSSPSISLDTVNRTLLTLHEMGEAFIVEGTGEPKRFDAGTEKHQHFKCVKCKRIIDFHYKPFDEIKVPSVIKKKFTVLRKTIYIEGICGRCGR